MNPISFKKKDDEIPSSSFLNMASNVVVRNTQRISLKIETSEELCANYESIAFRDLIWGPQNAGKTHFLCTHPEPICIIDTEDRVKLIMPKFRVCKDCDENYVTSEPHPKKPNTISGSKECPSCGSKNTRLKDIRKIKVNTSEEAKLAAQTFIDLLDKSGKIGTIGVDNISKIWDKLQNEYAAGKGLEINDHLDPRDDYKKINPQHNENFRDLLLSTKHNVVLIATARPLYDKDDRYKIVGTGSEGQKHNPFAVDWVIYTEEGQMLGQDGKLVGNGIFTANIIKNSIAAANIPPIQFLDYNKMVNLRNKLLESCGVDVKALKKEEK